MNLLFFTIHIERDRPSARSSERGAPPATRSHRWGVRWTGLAIAGLLCALVAGCAGWILAGGDPALLAGPDWLPFATTARADDQAWLEILTQPDGASVLVDGHARGQTPLSLPVTRGMHLLGLKHPEAVDEQRQLSISTDTRIDVRLWRRRPGVVQLRPAYPGASIADAAFLADGRLALSMAVPSQTSGAAGGTPREPWVFDPSSGSLAPLLDAAATPRAPLLSVSPDGRRVAYLQPDASDVRAGTPRPPLTSVWMLASADPTAPPVRLFALAAGSAHPTAGPTVPTEVEEVHDVTWTPDSQHLLVTVQLAGLGGGYPAAPRSRLLLVDAERSDRASAQPPAIELVTLPAEIVPGSYSWAADGHWVAFLTHASTGSGSAAFVALCAVDTSAGGAVSGFRYVADLGRQADVGSVLPVAPVAWSPMSDGRLVYVAATPRISVSNPLGLPGTAGGELVGHAAIG